MSAIRIILNKKWKHPLRQKPYPVGTILQTDLNLAGELMAENIARIYNGVYPPKEKLKMNLSQLN